MPVPLNLAVNLAFAAGLVRLTRRSPGLRRHFCSWQLWLLLAFEAAVFTPVATYLFCRFPQYALLYTLDPQLEPRCATT